MSSFDLEQAPARTRPVQRTDGRAAAEAGTLIGLQRLAGNSAVAQAIQSGRIGADRGQLDVQRLVDTDDDLDEDTADELEGMDEGELEEQLGEEQEQEEEQGFEGDVAMEEEGEEEETEEGEA